MSESQDHEQNEISLSRHVANRQLNGNIHLSISGKRREREIKRHFPELPSRLFSGVKFCKFDSTRYADKSSSGHRHTENPESATCQECIENAVKWKYGSFTNLSSSGTLRISKKSVENITNWIPKNCSIIISSNKVKVVDQLTKQEVEVQNITKAAILIAERYFKPLSPDDIVGNQSMLSRKIFDYNNLEFSVQGLNFNNQSKIFDGFILNSLNGNNMLKNLTFSNLFNTGYHFDDGTPCGTYAKNKQTSVELNEELDMNISNVADEVLS